MMTCIEDLRRSTADFITLEDVAAILHKSDMAIRQQAKNAPEKLGFAIINTGNRVIVPRRALLHYLDFGNAPIYYGEKA